MISDKCACNAPNIRGKVNKNCSKCPELDNSHSGRDLLGITVEDVCPAAGKNQMSRRTNRDKFSQTLHYSENNCLYQIHKNVMTTILCTKKKYVLSQKEH